MDVHEIDGRTFHAYGVPEFPDHLTPYREVRFLRSADGQTLGLILFDKCDKNYSACVFRRDAFGHYPLHDGRADLPTTETATEYAARAMLDAAGSPADQPAPIDRLLAD